MREYDLEAHCAALAALPEFWEQTRPRGPAPPAARAAHAVDAKKRRKAERAARRRKPASLLNRAPSIWCDGGLTAAATRAISPRGDGSRLRPAA